MAFLTKYYIEQHHEDEADGKTDGAEIGMMTAKAKPSSVFCKRGDISSFIRKMNAAPSMVPNRGMGNPKINVIGDQAG